MPSDDYPVLCGGTFFSLLLNAGKSRTSKRGNTKGETDGLSQPELLIELVKVIKPKFDPPEKESTLKKNVSNYRQCKDNGGSYFSVVFESNDVNVFDERLKNDYCGAHSDMAVLAARFIGEDKAEWLVKALLETINKSVTDKAVFIMGGQNMSKAELMEIDDVDIPTFVLGVWHYIVMEVRDNTVGQATFAAWHTKKGDANSEWVFTGIIGSKIKRNITIRPFRDIVSQSSASNGEAVTQDEPFINEEADAFADEQNIDAETVFTQYQQNNFNQTINVDGDNNIVNGFVFNLNSGK